MYREEEVSLCSLLIVGSLTDQTLSESFEPYGMMRMPFGIGAAIEQARYMALDAANALSMFIVNGMPDPVRFLERLGNLIATAGEAAKGANRRVSVFGECVHLLWTQGNAEAAIQMEKLGNNLTEIHDVDILCGYSLSSVEVAMDSHTREQICAEHSAVCSR